MHKRLFKSFRASLVFAVLFTALLGGAYPLLVTAVARAAFPAASGGALVEEGGKVVGSALLAQAFTGPGYFWPRPSAVTPSYNGIASGASNLSPGNPAFKETVQARIAALHKADPSNTKPIPADLVEASGSGLDPEISPEAAEYQLGRVARARGIPLDRLRGIVEEHTRPAQWGLFGRPRVNVLALNLALDAHKQ